MGPDPLFISWNPALCQYSNSNALLFNEQISTLKDGEFYRAFA